MAGWSGIGDALSKIADWIPGRRESRLKAIDNTKKEMVDVQNKKPFDSARYQRLVDKLSQLEAADKRDNK